VLVSFLTKLQNEYPMKTICQESPGQTSKEWRHEFLEVREIDFVKFLNKKRLASSGLLERIKTNQKICDAGCGNLSLLGQLKTLGYKHLYGFDIDEELIKCASLPENEFSEIKVGSACQIPYDDESFDAVVIWGIFHHINPKDYKTVLDELNRVLKPSGELFILEPYPFFFWKMVYIVAGFLSYFSLPNCKSINTLLESENGLLKSFSNNRKVIKNIIAKQYNTFRSTWHTGFWISGGIKK
jgi:ubiquinone/menaquinone biosynthesis C-methylase UbiE